MGPIRLQISENTNAINEKSAATPWFRTCSLLIIAVTELFELSYPPYSPDVASCHFILCAKLGKDTPNRNFNQMRELPPLVKLELRTSIKYFSDVLKKLEHHWVEHSM